MTQPKFAPIRFDDEVRPSFHLEVPRPWRSHRPGEFEASTAQTGVGFGTPGPDQGYALLLARRFSGRLVLRGESEDDVLTGAVAIALRRAAFFGRAPVSSDIEFGLSCFGFLTNASDDLVSIRKDWFANVAHDYDARRRLAARVPEAMLSRSPLEVAGDVEHWRRGAASFLNP